MDVNEHRLSPKSLEFHQPPTRDDIKQKPLARNCYWEAFDQVLWVDAREIYPEIGVIKLLAWDAILMDSNPVPVYPDFLKPLEWSKTAEVAAWAKLIPSWVSDSCRLFPSHQLTLLHYVGKYPQLLELLDHAPYLAWRLVSSGLQEPEIVALLSGKRQQIVKQLGWPGVKQTLKFLQNLRLRQVTPLIMEQVETCALDMERLQALQSLPRINSMALTLASRFPEMIGCRLHRSLAQQPCQPMQCQSMVALLEDVFRLIAQRQKGESALQQVRQCQVLSQVHQLYLQWMAQALPEHPIVQAIPASSVGQPNFVEQWRQQVYSSSIYSTITDLRCDLMAADLTEPVILTEFKDWQTLSLLQEHAWWLDYDEGKQLFVWQMTESENPLTVASKSASFLPAGQSLSAPIANKKRNLWAALVEPNKTQAGGPANILRIRGLQNQMPAAQQLSKLHLFLIRVFKIKTDE